MLKTPVLFITFARPEYARKSFDAIKSVMPLKLYFYSNKARIDKADEIERNNEVRNYINEIDWECDLKTFFREDYVEIYTSLRGAIDWVFENEEKAIILEEDCVASPDFFVYCDKLLPKYKNEPKVWMISGNNFTPEANPEGLSYFFSRYMHIYGWAGWADRWHKQDKMMLKYKELKFKPIYMYYGSLLKSITSIIYWNKVYHEYDRYNPWDHIFTYNMVKNRAYSVVPAVNLVVDIGVVGEHHKNIDENVGNKLESIVSNPFVISGEPEEIQITDYDNYHFKYHIFLPLIKRKFQLLLRKITLRK